MKIPKRSTGLATCLALACVSMAGAEGHTGGMQMRPDFDEIDTNGDGRITPAEMTAHMQARFDAADTDGDGLLSRDEMVSRMMERQADRMARRADRMIERHDADGDGQISLDEMQAARQGGMMNRMDRDDDGAISREEFTSGSGRHGDGHHGGKGRNADE